jgi:GT2 family glycosyltransferase
MSAPVERKVAGRAAQSSTGKANLLSPVPTCVPDLSVVIVTWNSREFINECLDAVYSVASSLQIEILVIDNASSDGGADLVRQHYPDVKLTVNGENLGCSAAFNQGLRESRGRYVQILCPDTIAQPGAFQEMITFLDAHPNTGAVGPKLTYPDGRPQPSCRTFPTYTIFAWEFLGVSRLLPRHPVFGRWRMGDFDHATVREVDQPRGSSLMVRRAVIEQVGLWDEELEMFFNDVDWCRRMKDYGWKIHFLPSAWMVHYGGSSVKKIRPRMILVSHRCCFRYFRKYGQGFSGKIGAAVLGLALLLSAAVRFVVAHVITRYERSGTDQSVGM